MNLGDKTLKGICYSSQRELLLEHLLLKLVLHVHTKRIRKWQAIDYIFPRWGIYNLCLNNVTSVKQTKTVNSQNVKNFPTQKWAHKNECFPANSPE